MAAPSCIHISNDLKQPTREGAESEGMMTKDLVEQLEQLAVTFANRAVSGYAHMDDKAQALRAAKDAADLAERLGRAMNYPCIYGPFEALRSLESNQD